MDEIIFGPPVYMCPLPGRVANQTATKYSSGEFQCCHILLSILALFC